MINLIGLNKADLLVALFNYAKDMKESKKVAPQSLEVAQAFLFAASAEVLAGKTDKTTTVKSPEVKQIMKIILDNKTKNEYLTTADAQALLVINTNIKEVNGVQIFINFKGTDIDSKKFNALYGQWAAESIVNAFKDEISFDKTGKIKKPKK